MKLKLLFASVLMIQLVAGADGPAIWKGEYMSLADRMKQYAILCPAIRIVHRREEPERHNVLKMAQVCAEKGDVDVHVRLDSDNKWEKSTACVWFHKYLDSYYAYSYDNYSLYEKYDLVEVAHPGPMKLYLDEMMDYYDLHINHWIRNLRSRISMKLYARNLIRQHLKLFKYTDDVCCKYERLGDFTLEIERVKKHYEQEISKSDLNILLNTLWKKFKKFQKFLKTYTYLYCEREKYIVRGHILYFYIELYHYRGFATEGRTDEILLPLIYYLETVRDGGDFVQGFQKLKGLIDNYLRN